MQFSFAGRALPMTLRVCRSLLLAQAALTILAGVFVVLVTSLLGSSDTIPFRGGALGGSGALMLGVGYIAAGLGLAWLGVELRRLAPWARPLIVGLLLLLAMLQVLRSFELSMSLVINVALSVAIIALLFAPDTQRAFAPQG
jgi:hypothetical protein